MQALPLIEFAFGAAYLQETGFVGTACFDAGELFSESDMARAHGCLEAAYLAKLRHLYIVYLIYASAAFLLLVRTSRRHTGMAPAAWPPAWLPRRGLLGRSGRLMTATTRAAAEAEEEEAGVAVRETEMRAKSGSGDDQAETFGGASATY